MENIDIHLDTVPPRPINNEELKKECQMFSDDDVRKKSWRNVLMKCLRYMQKYSAYTFSGFLGLHLASVVFFPGLRIPVKQCEEVFSMSREIYQAVPKFEAVAIIGAGACHVVSGVLIRLARVLRANNSRSRPTERLGEIFVSDKSKEASSDIGLGGITGLIGLGYRKSIISQKFPSLSPQQLSGYLLMPLIAYHFAKFRYIPQLLEGDSSLINLSYITHYLKRSPMGQMGNFINYSALVFLVLVGTYHFVSGILRFQRKFSKHYKKAGYASIASVFVLGMLSIHRFLHSSPVGGFLGTHFSLYTSHWRI